MCWLPWQQIMTLYVQVMDILDSILIVKEKTYIYLFLTVTHNITFTKLHATKLLRKKCNDN